MRRCDARGCVPELQRSGWISGGGDSGRLRSGCLLPGVCVCGSGIHAALFHVVSPVSGVIRWLGLHCGEPQALDARETLRWRLDIEETLEPSRVLFHADGTWHVLDGPLAAFAGCPVRMERRAAPGVCDGGAGRVARRVRFGVIPVREGSGP